MIKLEPNSTFIPYGIQCVLLYGIHKLRSALLVWPILLAALLLALPTTGPIEPTPVGATGRLPKSEQTSLVGLPLPAQFSISEAIGRDQSSYHLTPTADGFRATQPNQALTADFSPAGLDLRAGEDHWILSLTAYGYSDHLNLVEPARPQAEANRLEYRRGPLIEWYRHGPLGLQQGFTLSKRPASSGSAKATETPLTLALRLTGSGPTRVSEDGRSLKIGNLSYTGLLAYDAAGRDLPVWLELQDDRLLLRVDDRNATYPLFIDPWIQQAKLIASDGAAGDYFGSTVAVSGDTVVVGAYLDDDRGNDSGSVYVFVKPSGGWAAATLTQTTKLIAADGAANDYFGYDVAVSDDAIVVGAYGDDTYRGAAYVFVKSGGSWTNPIQTAKLTASDGAEGDNFGFSVAVSGDAVVVGAYYGDSQVVNSGLAYVFVKPSGGWATTNAYTTKLTASDGAVNDYFGSAVTVSGDTTIVGAYGEDNRRGSAYIFVKPSGGWTTAATLTQTTKLTASDGATSDHFGEAVAVSGDTVVVGAYGDDDRGDASGSAYVFVKPRDSGGWAAAAALTQTAKLIASASDGAAGDCFGSAVAINSDTVVVSAPWDDDRGSVYVFVKPSGGWVAAALTQTAKLTASDGAANDRFGRTVAVSGDTIVVGAFLDDDRGYDSGSAYVFTLLPSEMATQGKGQEIAAGDTTPSLIDDTDFGSAKVSGQPVVHTFTISNTGVATLTLTGTPPVTITGPAASDFSIISPPSSTVSVGSSTTFQVRFNPTVAGTRLATVSIANDDLDENPYDFAIQGVGIGNLYLPVVIKPLLTGVLTFRNDSGSPVTITLFDYETKAVYDRARVFGAGQHDWSDIPVGTYDWEATGSCGGALGTIGSTQPKSSPNYRAPITILANQKILLNAERGGRFSCGE